MVNPRRLLQSTGQGRRAPPPASQPAPPLAIDLHQLLVSAPHGYLPHETNRLVQIRWHDSTGIKFIHNQNCSIHNIQKKKKMYMYYSPNHNASKLQLFCASYLILQLIRKMCYKDMIYYFILFSTIIISPLTERKYIFIIQRNTKKMNNTCLNVWVTIYIMYIKYSLITFTMIS